MHNSSSLARARLFTLKSKQAPVSQTFHTFLFSSTIVRRTHSRPGRRSLDDPTLQRRVRVLLLPWKVDPRRGTMNTIVTDSACDFPLAVVRSPTRFSASEFPRNFSHGCPTGTDEGRSFARPNCRSRFPKLTRRPSRRRGDRAVGARTSRPSRRVLVAKGRSRLKIFKRQLYLH